MSKDTEPLAQDILQVIPQIMRILAVEFRRSGHLMTPGNFQLMFMLLDGPANLSELAEYQSVSLPTMSRSVSRLEKIGWVKRSSDPHDRRVTLIELTEDGCRRLEEMAQLAEEIIGGLMKSTSADDRKALAAGLEVMRRTFDLYEIQKE